MKILQIIDSLDTGGAEKLLTELVPIVNKSGYEVDILLLNGKITPFYEEIMDTKTCQIFSLGNSFYNPLYIFKIIPYLRKYNIIHVHLFPAQYFTVFAKLLSFSKCKLIFTEHSTDNKRMNKSWFKPIETFIYSKYTKVIGITEQVCQVLHTKQNLPKEKIVKIENGININKINEARAYEREDFGYTNSCKLIVMVAGFREQKDHATLIRAFVSLPIHYKLVLIGDGDRRNEIQSLVAKLHLINRVNFLGVRKDVYNIMKMCDIAVLSSHWEGFGLAAAEAMACGIPVIVSNVPGLAQVVNGAGLLFQQGNVMDLKTNILLLEDPCRYDSIKKKCRERAMKYDISLMIDKTLNLYESL